MKKKDRLTARADFQRLLDGRRVFAGAALVAFALPGRREHTRVGVGASRRIRGAVARNRARRRIREAARLELLAEGSNRPPAGIPFDVVLIARPDALRLPFQRIAEELAQFRSRLRRSR